MTILMRSSLLAVLTAIVGLTTGCKDKANSATASSDASPTTPTAPTASVTTPFALKIYSMYDGTQYVNPLTFSETGTDTCQATTSNPSVTCTVVVPEGRLYFSSLTFAFSWMPSQCTLLTFQPYYYQASNVAGYLPPGATSTIDCSVGASELPVGCFGGVGTELVPNFPLYRSLIYLPDETDLNAPNSKTITGSSGYSKKTGSNRYMVNDMPPAKVGNNYTAAQMGNIGDTYLANTYTNYKFACRDHWYDPESYTVNLYIQDEDSMAGNPTQDNFLTWKELP